jgi:hypothetical protein
MRESKPVSVAAALGVIAVWGVVYACLHTGSPVLNPKPHEATGWVMAEQALALLKPGGQVIVIARDTVAFKNPASDIQLAGFRKTLAKARTTVGVLHSVQVDPLRPMQVPPGDFLEYIRSAPAGSVIVSFMGPPLLNEAQRAQLRDNHSAIVAFCAGPLPQQVSLPSLFNQGLLQAAVVSRRDQDPGAAKPHDLRGWFDRSFLLIDGNNVGTMSLADRTEH